jgi:hypothetical protein
MSSTAVQGTSPESLLLLLYGRSWKEELRGQYK